MLRRKRLCAHEFAEDDSRLRRHPQEVEGREMTMIIGAFKAALMRIDSSVLQSISMN